MYTFIIFNIGVPGNMGNASDRIFRARNIKAVRTQYFYYHNFIFTTFILTFVTLILSNTYVQLK